MLIIQTIVFAIIQGLTEFLPVSSSGHLVILHHFIDLNLSDSLAFDVALHLGTLLALLLYFYKDVVRLIKSFFVSLIKWDLKQDFNQRLSWMIIIASIPVFLVGFFGANFLANTFRSVTNVATMLIFFGLLFFFYEKIGQKNENLENLSMKQAVKIGIAQIFALIPGVSRSGITIIAGLGENLKREEAARFSFLLAMPAVLGAGVKKTYDLSKSGFLQNEILIFAIGFVVAAIVGYFCIKYFLRYLKNHSLNVFGWYRIALGALILILVKFYG